MLHSLRLGPSRPSTSLCRSSLPSFRHSSRSFNLRRLTSLANKTVLEPSVAESELSNQSEEIEEEIECDPLTSQQLKALITSVCSGNKIAQLELRMGSNRVKIRRSSMGVSIPQGMPQNEVVEPAPIYPTEKSLEDSFMEDEAGSIDESLIMIDSPVVGFFRLGIFDKNGRKVGKGPEPGDQVRPGQPLCAIEQLGTFTPILSPQQGEVLAFPFSDGEPVAYKEAVVEFAPYFGGHIIGDRKYT